MLWILLALFFWWLIYRELKGPLQDFLGLERTDPKPVFKGYLAALFILASSCSWPPLNYWHFQNYLTHIARELSENPMTKVHCNTLFY